MLLDATLLKIVEETGICPWIDCCCDLLGSNSLGPFYYSALEDSRKQNLEGLPFMMNPPFKNAKSFVEMCEAAYRRDTGTAPILIMPNDSKKYCQ